MNEYLLSERLFVSRACLDLKEGRSGLEEWLNAPKYQLCGKIKIKQSAYRCVKLHPEGTLLLNTNLIGLLVSGARHEKEALPLAMQGSEKIDAAK